MKFIEIIIITIISSGIIAGILAYVAKIFLGQFIAKELDRLQLELEFFRTSLNREFQAVSTESLQLNQRRTTAVLEIHDRMCEIEELVIWKSGGVDKALTKTSPEVRVIEALNEAWEDIAKLKRILNYHSFFFDVKIYEYINGWSKMMMALVSETGNEIEAIRQDGTNIREPLLQRQELIKNIRDKYLESYIPQLGAIRKEIDTEFRKILGLAFRLWRFTTHPTGSWATINLRLSDAENILNIYRLVNFSVKENQGKKPGGIRGAMEKRILRRVRGGEGSGTFIGARRINLPVICRSIYK
jgi:hypothetical protein